MRYSTISAIGDFTALSPASTDYLHLDPSACTGGVAAPLRTNVEDKPGADGPLIFPPLDGPQIITLSGVLVVRSATGAGYFTAMDTLLASLQSALDALKTAPDDLVHSGGTLSVWLYSAISDGWEGMGKTVTFGLVVDP